MARKVKLTADGFPVTRFPRTKADKNASKSWGMEFLDQWRQDYKAQNPPVTEPNKKLVIYKNKNGKVVSYWRTYKPKPTATVKEEGNGTRERRIYGGATKDQFKEWAEQQSKKKFKNPQAKRLGNDRWEQEAYNLKAGVMGFAERYGDPIYQDIIAQMDPTILKRMYDQGSFVFEYYFQYTGVGYNPDTGEWDASGIDIEDQFEFLIQKYNEYAKALGEEEVGV